ncbi:MAG: Ig-like domain-containing protein, partial [Anaerolineales bacterium]
MTATFNILLTILFLFSSPRESRQEDQLHIRLRRNWGFSSGTGKIQGAFTIISNGPVNVSRVVFYIDDQVLGEVSEEPLNFQFNTDNYALGPHRLYALGYTNGGKELSSNILQVEFVSSEEGWQLVMKIIILLVVIVGLAFLVPLIFTRGKVEQLPP